MTSRFDFEYWPPRPIEQPPVVPAQSAPSEELCRDLLLIPDEDRRRAVYATDEWVDIEDFWIETLREPHPHDVRAYTIPDRTRQVPESFFRSFGRKHLQNATYTFHRLAYEVAAHADDDLENENPLIKSLDEHGITNHHGDTRVEGFLFHHVFPQWDKRFSNQQILIARRAVIDVFEGIDPLPTGLGKDGQEILARVALRWHTNFLQNSYNI